MTDQSPRIRSNQMVNSYTSLLRRVRDAGLLRRRRRFYLVLLGILLVLFAAAWAGFFLLGHSWYQLLIAAALGILFTQFALLGHEAAHHQVFASRGANDWFARLIGTVMVGMSHAYWVNKHTRHHNHPNTIGMDPDIKTGAIAFHEQGAIGRGPAMALVTRRQGYLVFPLLIFLGVMLHLDSFRFLARRSPINYRWVEIPAIIVRLGVYFALIFLFLPLGMAFAFIGLQLGVFGFYMGASFAPNHKGMPILPEGSRVDFLSRQVLTSRNITGGWFITLLMGGLNYQVEHHLFPDMPRPQLRTAQKIVRAHCADLGIPYTETSLFVSYGIVVRYLNRVGLSAADPFECPLAGRYGPQ